MKRKGKMVSLSLLQIDTTPAKRRMHVSRTLDTVAVIARKKPGILVLPEIWSGGFEYPAIREVAGQTGKIVKELRKISQDHGSIIIGSLPELRSGRLYNTGYLIDQGVVAGRYRKQHLFAPMGEDRHFTAGRRHGIFATSAGTIGIAICFDLRFPELFAGMRKKGVWLLVVPAQWPHPRCGHWESLLVARAIEGQFFVAGCNRVGSVGQTRFCGRSLVVDPLGRTVGRAGAGSQIVTGRLDPLQVMELRRRLPMD